MKLLLLPCLVAGLLLTTSCEKVDLVPEPEPVICPPAPTVAKTVKDQEGTVRFNATTKQYAIVTPPRATGAIDVGIVIGSLPTALQVDGLKVIFSGTYYVIPGAPVADVAEYLLGVSSIAAQ